MALIMEEMRALENRGIIQQIQEQCNSATVQLLLTTKMCKARGSLKLIGKIVMVCSGSHSLNGINLAIYNGRSNDGRKRPILSQNLY